MESSLTNVLIESDCLIVVQAVTSSMAMFSPFGLLVKDCRALLSMLCNVSLHFVKRSANNVAHSIARASCSQSDRIFNRGDVSVNGLSTLVGNILS